uniref:Ig-like domain-containing protein n=1 Tax=Astyanax mexicanus TaxID=7994 RepID=A0A3B1IKH8_ASTMX
MSGVWKFRFMRWFKNGLELLMDQSEHGISQIQNGSLLIGSVAASQSGDYKCLAVNEADEWTVCIKLMLILSSTYPVPPEIWGDKVTNLTVTLKHPMTLSCDAHGVPIPSITWTKDGKPVRSHLQIFSNGTLHISATQRSDSGLYTCSARNIAGRASQDIRLLIQGELLSKQSCSPPSVLHTP